MHIKNKTAKKYRGFTMIELLIVITIMGIIVIVGYPSYQAYLAKARRQEAIQNISVLQIAIEAYIAKNNSLPSKTEPFIVAAQEPNDSCYKITYMPIDNAALIYKISAIAKDGTTQADDIAGTVSCATITLDRTMDGVMPLECG